MWFGLHKNLDMMSEDALEKHLERLKKIDDKISVIGAPLMTLAVISIFGTSLFFISGTALWGAFAASVLLGAMAVGTPLEYIEKKCCKDIIAGNKLLNQFRLEREAKELRQQTAELEEQKRQTTLKAEAAVRDRQHLLEEFEDAALNGTEETVTVHRPLRLKIPDASPPA